ncbi:MULTISPECIES: response regulator [Sphingomonadales]|jgi:FixJ family two-component response regulator|uniref:Response regulator n=1 Tax=Novosphingobium soli TaxID=574956 RepID=A0ABV6CTQ1_9SPHN|nr:MULTISPECIES: response regulator [Sphingomonadaceae]MBS88177.1 response regulator [Sphingobium sp.]MCW1431928.1 response regulator [Novosphingobium sp. JCM 18896]
MSSRRSPSNRKYRVLLSDDDPAVRRALHLLLRSHGYQVCGYTTGRALLADPEALDAHCVILDYRMPDIDGFAMLEQLRAQGWNGTAIMISGFHDNCLVRRAHEAGFDHVIPKPLIGRAVLDAVGRHARSGLQ